MIRVVRPIVVAAAALACGWALWTFAIHPCRCNAGVSAVAYRTEAAEAATIDYQRVVLARRNLAQLAGLRSCRTEVRVPMLAGANEELLGRLDDALRSYREALLVERRPEIYAAVARVQIQTGHVEEGVSSYVTAARFTPGIIDVIQSEEVMRMVQERLRARP